MKYTCHFLYVHRLQDKRESSELNNLVERGWTEASFGSRDFEPVRALLSCLGSPTEPAVLLFVKQLFSPSLFAFMPQNIPLLFAAAQL